MCGIVGYVGDKSAAQVLVGGLRKLEYRGYDSAGIAVHSNGELQVRRAKGKLANLEAVLLQQALPGTVGIGHTRWATHGRPSDENAHPHRFKDVAIIHNGIIENHLALKEELRAQGHSFASDTDSEIFAHLVCRQVDAGLPLEKAVRAAVDRVEGTYALVVACGRFPDEVVAAKSHNPLVVGLGQGENFVASDTPALLEHTRDFQFLEEGDLVVLKKGSVRILDPKGNEVKRALRRVDWTPMMAEKNGHKHFMHKEIFEQPQAIADTIRGRSLVEEGDVHLDDFPLSAEQVQGLEKVVVLACGTSWHAGLVGKWAIESLARIPVEVELASEFRYRDPIVNGRMLAIAVSQSGETADTLAALREAKKRGAHTGAVCNVLGSNIPREAGFTVYTHAGPEIGVASTKCFTTQLVAMILLGLKLGRMKGTLSASQVREHLGHLRELPKQVEAALQQEPAIKAMSREFSTARDALFLGRGPLFPLALEGALKLKEISYLHAEGYAAGEMKHGPIALIDEKMPVVVLALKGASYEKMLGTVSEVQARDGRVYALLTEGQTELAKTVQGHIVLPDVPALYATVLAAVPLQLLAYFVADARGTDVDQPRNLAKSVTVE
jgi:glucosamine--fructose-6-phosphate aminotransferase (isomerizing)